MTQIESLVNEFCRRSELAPATRSYYRWNLERLLIPFCQREGLTQPAELTSDVIEQLAHEVDAYRKADGQPLARASRRAYMKALQQFLAWLSERHGVGGLDSRAVPVPAKRRTRRTVPSREEIQAMEDAAPTERNKLIVRLLGDTGAREGEVANLRCDGLVSKGGRYYYLEIEGKTGRRTVPISPQLHRRLTMYRDGKSGRPRSSSPFLFLSRTQGPLTEKGIYRVIKDCVLRAELDRRIYPHLLRHAAITWMLARPPGGLGLPDSYVVEITGASSAVIAAHYDHATDEQLWAAMSQGW